MSFSRSPKGLTAQQAFYGLKEIDFPSRKAERDVTHAVESDVRDQVAEHERAAQEQAQAHIAKQSQAVQDARALIDTLRDFSQQTASLSGAELARQAQLMGGLAEGLADALSDTAERAAWHQERLADPLASLSRLQTTYPPLRGTYGQDLSPEGLSKTMRSWSDASSRHRP